MECEKEERGSVCVRESENWKCGGNKKDLTLEEQTKFENEPVTASIIHRISSGTRLSADMGVCELKDLGR